MELDLCEVPFYAELKRDYGLTTAQVLLYGAIVAYTRCGASPTLNDLARASGSLMRGDQRAALRRMLVRLVDAGLVVYEASLGRRPSRYTPITNGSPTREITPLVLGA